MRNYALVFIGLWYVCGETQADCVSDVMSGKGRFMQCIAALNVGFNMIDGSNPYSICQGSVSDQFSCLNDYVMACPQLIEGNSQFASIVPALDQFKSLCSKNRNASPDQRCPQLVRCTEQSDGEIDPPKYEANQHGGNSTPFSMIPNLVHSLCSLLKRQMVCFDSNREACPEDVENAERFWYGAISNYTSRKYSYESIKMLTKDLCPRIPSGFTSNTCVREQLESDGFISCMARVKKMSLDAPREEQCQYYDNGKACIEDHIGRTCGQENAKVIIDTAPLVIHDLPQDCNKPQKPSSDDKNACDMIRSVVGTLLLCLIVCILQSR